MFPFKLSSTEISPDYFYTYNVLRRVYHLSDHLSLWNLLTMDCQCWELLIFPNNFTVVTDNCFWYWSPLSFTPCGVQGSNKLPQPLPILGQLRYWSQVCCMALCSFPLSFSMMSLVSPSFVCLLGSSAELFSLSEGNDSYWYLPTLL